MQQTANYSDFQTAFQWMRCSARNSNFKLCRAGSYVELDVYGHSVPLPNLSTRSEHHSKAAHNGTSGSSSIMDLLDEIDATDYHQQPAEAYTPEKGRKKHASRNSKKIRLLINQNFQPESSWLVTFTMKDHLIFEEARKRFKTLLGKLRNNVLGIKWLAVPEIGEQGGYHLHMIIDRELPMTRDDAEPFIEQGVIKTCAGALQSMWKHGFIHAKALNGGGNLGAHLGRYLSKNATHPDMKNRHTFYRSDNLDQWIEMRGQNAIDYIAEHIIEPGRQPIYSYYKDDIEYIEWIKHFEFCFDIAADPVYKRIEPAPAA